MKIFHLAEMPSETRPSSIIAVSSSRACRRPCHKTTAPLLEDPTPRIPWRVLSLPTSSPTPVLVGDGQQATAVKEDPCCKKTELVPSDDNNSSTPTTKRINGENTTVCCVRSSTGNGAPAAAVPVGDRSFADGLTSSRSSRPSKGVLIGLGLALDDHPSCDSASATRTKSERFGVASWEREASKRGMLQVTMPRISGSNTDASHAPCLPAAPLAVVNGVCCNRREWSATPPIKAHRVAKHSRLHPQEGIETSKEPSRSASEVREAGEAPRVPKTSPRPMCAWGVLRRRTLKATQREPSIFRRNIQGNREAGAVQESRQPARWYILNRRIFGVREVARRGVIAFPEWMMFSGGVPPSGLDDQSRWALRLGRYWENISFNGDLK